MKKIQKIASIFMSLGMVFTVSGCFQEWPYQERQMVDKNGIWNCEYILGTGKTECAVGNYLAVNNLEYIFIPTHINGIKVVQIGYASFFNDGKVGAIETKKVFLPYGIKTVLVCAGDNFYTSGKELELSASELNGETVYIPKAYEDYYKQSKVYFANVVYDINYENEEYQYHSVDNYKYGSLIEIVPPDPEREGYTFDGWYKESECVNEWDFETDTLPEEIKDESGEVLFQETALYAKWIRYT